MAKEITLHRPLFIVIDGVDGTGKSTQVDMLVSYLQRCGNKVESSKEPGGTPIGSAIRELLLSKDTVIEPDTELLLFCADRVEHQKKVRNLLADGVSIVSDRFLSSTWAYQIYGRGLGPSLLTVISEYIVRTLPDMTIILDMDEKTAVERAKKRLAGSLSDSAEGRFEAESSAFFNRVRAGFLKYAEIGRYGKCYVVDASGNEEEVFHKVLQTIAEHIEC